MDNIVVERKDNIISGGKGWEFDKKNKKWEKQSMIGQIYEPKNLKDKGGWYIIGYVVIMMIHVIVAIVLLMCIVYFFYNPSQWGLVLTTMGGHILFGLIAVWLVWLVTMDSHWRGQNKAMLNYYDIPMEELDNLREMKQMMKENQMNNS